MVAVIRASRGIVHQNTIGDCVLHARSLELAAVPLRPINGIGMEGDVTAGLDQPGRRRSV